MKVSKAATWRKAASQLLALAARPVRRAQGRHGTVLEAYRGYGSRDEIFLIGRVFRQSRPEAIEGDGEIRRNLRDIGRRIRRRRVPDVPVVARFAGSEERVVTDRDGYFRIALRPLQLPAGEGPWHPVDLTVEVEPPVRGQAQVFVPTTRCRFLLISDVDDTVMHTGVANRLKMLWRLFVADAENRVAFPGVAAFYRALHAGETGDQGNPMLYVSRAPWGIYDMLSTFFTLNRIPEGPVLFLREWGLSWKRPWPRRAEDHKRALIAHMLALYADLPVVLIGDSGQHDPEIYARIVEDHPGRVRAVYIRNVSPAAGRIADIERLAVAVSAAGSSLVLAADSVAMAEHATGLGLIAAEAVAEIAREQGHDPAEPARPVAAEDVRAVLAGKPAEPPSIVVE